MKNNHSFEDYLDYIPKLSLFQNKDFQFRDIFLAVYKKDNIATS